MTTIVKTQAMAGQSHLRAFIALELIGAIGMALILTTAIVGRRTVGRSATWHSFCASWVVSCISYCLLFFAGAYGEVYPSRELCVVQAALMYSTPTLTALTTFALLIHGWYNVHFGLGRPPLETSKVALASLITGPYIAWFMMFIIFLVIGFRDVTAALRWDFYCIFVDPLPVMVSSLVVIVATFSMIPIQVSLSVTLCRWCTAQEAGRSSPWNQATKMMIRIMVFSVFTLIAFAEGLLHLFVASPAPVATVIMGILPVAAVFVFGMQRDLFEVWRIRKKTVLWLSASNEVSKT